MDDHKFLMHHVENNLYWKDLVRALERLLTVYKFDYIEQCLTQKLCELDKEECGDDTSDEEDITSVQVKRSRIKNSR